MHFRVGTCTVLVLAFGVFLTAAGQRGGRGMLNPGDDPQPQPYQSDVARAKAERERNLQDATRLAELAGKVKRDLETASSFTLSLATIKDTDEMAKLSKSLHSRLKSAGARPDALPAPYDPAKGPPKL